MNEKDLNWRTIHYDDNGFDEIDQMTEADVRRNSDFVSANVWEKLEAVGKKISFAKDIVALFKYMKDGSVQWYRKGIVVAALIYFISPIDAIPDLAPLIGYLDDLGVITAVLKYLGHELMQYYD